MLSPGFREASPSIFSRNASPKPPHLLYQSYNFEETPVIAHPFFSAFIPQPPVAPGVFADGALM